VDFRVIDGPLGDEQALLSLTAAAKSHGIRVIADLVLNHMANFGHDNPLEYPPKEVRKERRIGGLFSPQDFHSAFCIQNWNNAEEARRGRICGGGGDAGLPDLDHSKDWVIKVQRDYVAKLNDIGIMGYRVDAAKHMDIWALNKIFTPELTGNRHVFGEVIAFKSNFRADLEPYLRETRMGFMDFPLQETLRRAFSMGGSLELLRDPHVREEALAWDRAVTFAVNHDIPNNEGFRYMIMENREEWLATVYLTSRSEGVPQIMSDLGKADGLTTDRWKHNHRNPDLAKMLQFRNATAGTGSRVAWVNPCVYVIERGNKGLAGINKCEHTFEESVAVNLEGTLEELFTQKKVEVAQKGRLSLKIPGRGAVLLLKSL
jgi:alpha-amylase